ncbi:MAG: zinc-dependent alcohol dehydrogenase family protein [Polyangiales bacterium]
MKSVVLRNFGQGADAVDVVDAPMPEPQANQVRVRMLRSPVNPSDFNYIRGTYLDALRDLVWNRHREIPSFDPAHSMPHPMPPYVLGGEGVGIVDACGSGWLARRLKGKRVALSSGPPNGTWQEYVVVDATRAFPVPSNLSHDQAAGLIVNPMAVYGMLYDRFSLERGKWLMQSGAGSALAKMVIRVCRERGVRTINFVRNEKHIDALKAIGADEVVVTTGYDIADRVQEITAGAGADYGLDCIGGHTATSMAGALGVNGHLILYGSLGGATFELPSRALMMPCARVEGFYLGGWIGRQSLMKRVRMVRTVQRWAARGLLDVPIDRMFGLEQVYDALDAASVSGRNGKVLLKMAD